MDSTFFIEKWTAEKKLWLEKRSQCFIIPPLASENKKKHVRVIVSEMLLESNESNQCMGMFDRCKETKKVDYVANKGLDTYANNTKNAFKRRPRRKSHTTTLVRSGYVSFNCNYKCRFVSCWSTHSDEFMHLGRV
jgi:hypothetical protein